MKKIYWIGSRESDIIDENLFFGSITRFGSDDKNNYSFCNNKFTDDYQTFIRSCTNEIIAKDRNSYFIFANEMLAYQCGKDVYSKSLCLNKLSTIEALSNKIFVRNYMSTVVNIPECIVINSSSASDIFLIRAIFNNSTDNFVVQLPYGAGGEETVFLSNYEKNQSYLQQVLITPYIDNNIPLNVHIAVAGNDYRVFPPSVQIIQEDFKFVGSDYIKYNELNVVIKQKVINTCNEIARKVCCLGCNGIFGVDLIVKENNVFFLECNYRYQGSTFLLNKALIENEYPSFFKIQYDSFYNNLNSIPIDIYTMPIKYSSFRRTINNKCVKLPTPYDIKKDGKDLFNELRNGYIQYEIFDRSIIDLIQK